MKRLLAVISLTAIVAGVPPALISTTGSHGLPSAGAFGGLDSTYMPLAPILRVLALFAWALWIYVALAIVLRIIAVLVARRTGSEGLLRVTNFVAPPLLRRFVDLAVGGAIVVASLSIVRTSLAQPLPSAAATATVAPVTHGEVHEQKPQTAPTYQVRTGDSLWRIAERRLGSGFRWNEIYRLNKGKHFPDGRTLTDARLIHPGWVLELPAEAARTPHHDRPRATSTPAPTQESLPATTPSPAATSAPAPRMSLNASRPGAHPTIHTEEHDPETRAPGPVVKLPSGAVVAASFACGLLSAELLARLRRRRARRPLSDDGDIEMPERLIRDLRAGGATPTSSPIDIAVDEVAAAWRVHAGEWPRILAAVESRQRIEIILDSTRTDLPRPSGGSMSPQIHFDKTDRFVKAEVTSPFPVRLRRVSTSMQRGLLGPIGHVGDRTAVHVAPLGLGVISVAGVAAEKLVAQMLLTQAAESELADLQVVLLGATELGRSVGVPHVAHNVEWDDASEILQNIQGKFVRRADLFQQEGVENIWEHLATHSDEQLPALLLVVADPPTQVRGSIEAICTQAPRFGVAVVALDWRPVCSLHVTATTDALDIETQLAIPAKLVPFVLDETAMRDAIHVVARAAEEEEAPSIEGLAEGDSENRMIVLPPARPSSMELPARSDCKAPTPPPGVPAVHCLGAFRVSRDGRVRQKGWLKKSRELLAYLVAHPDGAPKERICDELWPGEDPPQYYLDKALSTVRVQVRTQNDPRMYLIKVEEAWRLEEGSWWVDVFEFARLVTEAERDEVAESVKKLRQAVSLYRGNFCDELSYPWAEPVRERYRSMFTRAAARLSEILADAGEYEEALEVLERAIQIDILCEDLWRRAMLIEAALGRRAAAADRYKKLAELLARELDVEPDPETQGIARSLTSNHRHVVVAGEMPASSTAR